MLHPLKNGSCRSWPRSLAPILRRKGGGRCRSLSHTCPASAECRRRAFETGAREVHAVAARRRLGRCYNSEVQRRRGFKEETAEPTQLRICPTPTPAAPR